MVRSNRNSVYMAMDRNYFDKCFEPERRKLQKKLGLNNLTQQKFTAILHASGAKIKFPKRNNSFLAKKPNFGRLNF